MASAKHEPIVKTGVVRFSVLFDTPAFIVVLKRSINYVTANT